MDAFYGEIRAFSFDYAPENWALCWGQSLYIQQNQVLFALINIKFGGDGKSTFNVPDLRGRIAVGTGSAPGLTPVAWGRAFGNETGTITLNQMAAHSHPLNAKAIGPNTTTPNANSSIANGPGVGRQAVKLYSPTATEQGLPLQPNVISSTGSGLPHENRQPYLTMNYCICINGLWPSHP